MGSKQHLLPEVRWYMDLERRARAKWGKTLAELEPPSSAASNTQRESA
jgi:hypothetical protein